MYNCNNSSPNIFTQKTAVVYSLSAPNVQMFPKCMQRCTKYAKVYKFVDVMGSKPNFSRIVYCRIPLGHKVVKRAVSLQCTILEKFGSFPSL